MAKWNIHAAGPSEESVRPGGPDDPRNHERFEWGAPGLPATPWEADAAHADEEKARDKELRREGDASDTTSMKSFLGKPKDESLDDLS